jgi:alkylhydroperoxidase/carboxymuconolactone decarboxylase family protein YurZ
VQAFHPDWAMRGVDACDAIDEVVADHEETLRKLSIRDVGYVERVLSNDHANLAASCLDPKTHALVRLAALAVVDAAPPSYMDSVDAARLGGATDDEMAGVLVAVAPAIGVARVVSAAPKLALALGYDVGAALEDLDEG